MTQPHVASISATPIELAPHLDAVAHPSAGAVATFIGQVRDNDPDADGVVVALEYSAHPSAQTRLAEIIAEASTAGARVAASHRVGNLQVGDIALIVCVSTPHRAEAFELCRLIVETIKKDLPVWKRQHDSTGRQAWVGV